MMIAAPVPLPLLTEDNTAFWRGGRQGKLLINRCSDCAFWVHPPAPLCRRCHSTRVEPVPVSGAGTIFSFTENYQPWLPGLEVPYVLAIVELDEQPGLRLTTRLVDCNAGAVKIGQRAQVTFEQHDDIWLPLFRAV
jgi:uncharacterized protein